jgi:hypothetical protein
MKKKTETVIEMKQGSDGIFRPGKEIIEEKPASVPEKAKQSRKKSGRGKMTETFLDPIEVLEEIGKSVFNEYAQIIRSHFGFRR